MIVISDTSAITSLLQIGKEGVLQTAFSRVIIPPAVRDELLQYHTAVPQFIEVIAVANVSEVSGLMGDLDRGEAEAIVLAAEIKPDFLLIDDWAAREVAIGKKLPVIGLLGVLVKAKRGGAIDSLSDVIDDLETKAGFRISASLRDEVLRLVGE